MAFRGAIFDLDGTVLDSMTVWDHVLPNFLRGKGFALEPGLMNEVAGMTFTESSNYVKTLYGLAESPEEIQTAWCEEARRQYAEEVVEKEGASNFIRALKAADIRLSVATTCMRDLAEAALEHLQLSFLLNPVFYADELRMNKRDPWIYELCAKAMGVLPSECAVFEDSYGTLDAVRKAGMKFVGVFDEKNAANEARLRREGDLFVTHWDGLTVAQIARLFS
ncbi:HAD family hydrolase [Gehongia tenuis]|uniref:HAD family phosphatase n=1 Tax=Gehongia tenuis TaxID=2763655 RepID=A0A926HP57_9FIRM|nr:HAD family phosphatase [Gehongia tenuis]MBC8531319.1 HAD family phosphatase [Gehongia tenuis]